MPDPENNNDKSVEIARITSRWQIITALLGVCSALAIALLSSDLLKPAPTIAACDVTELAGTYGDSPAWEFELDLLSGQFESEEQDGEGRIDGTAMALCTSSQIMARFEGLRSETGQPVLCLLEGARTGAEGRTVTGRFVCDDLLPDQNNTNYWTGNVRLTSDS